MNERNKNVGGSKTRVKTERLRARMDPLSDATPTYSSAGVSGSPGAMRALTRSRKSEYSIGWGFCGEVNDHARSTACSMPIHSETAPCTRL